MPTVAELIVRSLELNGFQHLFCLPGVQNDDFFDALHARQAAVRPVHVRHEQAAGYMATGAAIATGRPQAYCVVPGPGLLNTTAALATAYAVNAPVLALTSEIASGAIGKGYGLLHEIPDQSAVLASLTKWQARIDRAEDAAALTARAMTELVQGRPRPVGLQCPMDLWSAPVEGPLPQAPATATAPALDEAALDRAAQLLARAERPMLFVGSGAQAAAPGVRALAATLQAPVCAFRSGHGVMDARDPLSVTAPAGHRLWAQADVVLAVGTRLQTPQMAWGVDDKLTIIHLDIDAESIGRHGQPGLGIQCDAVRGVAALNARLEGVQRPARGAETQAVKDAAAAEYAELEPQLAFIRAIRDVLPEDGIFVDELTQVGYVSRFAFPVYQPRTFLSTGYQGTLGWGLPAALGAKVVCPDQAVVSIAGDGGFMFNVGELATAVRHNIAAVSIVFNDGAFGNVRRIQAERFDGRVIASDLVNPSFAALANEFGALGLTATDPGALRAALDQALSADRPAVIEVPVGEMPSPWGHIVRARVRGV